MAEPVHSKRDLFLEASIPEGLVPLESVLRNEELRRRPSRTPEHEKENHALFALAGALADSPGTILQTLAEKVLEVLRADSAGLSLLTKDEKRFYWAAIAGAWQPHIGGGTPRNFGPCGDVLDHNIPMLFTHWERRYPYLSPATPLAEEGLLAPFCVQGRAVGTIWAIAHNEHRKFDLEDLRLLESLGRFAAAAYQTVASIDDLKIEVSEREKALPNDAFGLGYFYVNFSDALQSTLNPLLTFNDEQGVEAFYNCAVIEWLQVSADLEYVNPALGDTDNAFVGALRARIRF